MKLKLFLLVPFLFLSTGCFDYNELNKLALVTGLSIDKKNNVYEVGILVADSKKDNDSNIVIKGKGKTLSEALKEIELSSPKKLYLGHLGVVIISDSIAKNGLNEIADFLIRDPESAKRFYMVLAKDSKAIDGLKVISPNLSFESQSLYQNIKISSESQAISLNVPFIDFVETLVTEGENGVIPSIKISKNKTKIDNIGLFRNDKLIGYASNDASIGISLLKNSVSQMILSSSCNGGNTVINISNIDTKVNANNDIVKIKITGDAYLKEVNCYMDINSEKAIKQLEKSFEKEVTKKVNKAITESKNYKTDIFGYGNLIYKRNPNYFKRIKNKWDSKYYGDLDTSIDVDIKLSNEGSIIKTIKEATVEK